MKSIQCFLFLLYEFGINEIINPHAVALRNEAKTDHSKQFRKRGGVARLVSDSSEPLFKDSASNQYLIVNYTFDNQILGSAKIKDDSGFDNNGIIDVGGLLVDITGSTCKVAAYLWDQSIKITFGTPDGVPKDGLSVTMWIKMLKPEGERTVFIARGKHFGIMSIKFFDNIAKFSYTQCEECTPYFDLMSDTSVSHDWFHLVATYNATFGIAMLYINGVPLNRTVSTKQGPFQYWGNDVRVGGHNHPSLKGFVDSILIYNYALTNEYIEFLSLTCCFHGCEELNIPSDNYLSSLRKLSLFQPQPFDRRSLRHNIYLNQR